MSVEELRKNIDEMQAAFDCVVTKATEPVRTKIGAQFDELIKKVDEKLGKVIEKEISLGAAYDDLEGIIKSLKVIMETANNIVNKLMQPQDQAMALLDTLSMAFEKCRWEVGENKISYRR